MLPGLEAAAASSGLWGQPVVSIRLQSDADLSIKDFAGAITQKLGEPLDRLKVAESLKNLYATGRFLDLRADAELAANGVKLVFVAHAQYFVGTVRVEETPGPLEPRVLVTASRLRLGQPLSQEDLATAHHHLSELLAANGYYQARVEHRLLPDPHTQEVGVVFLVSPGRPARLSAVEFQNHAAFPPERLAAVAGWRSGTHLTAARVQRGLFKIHQFYVSRGRLQATTSILKRVYDPKLNTEKLLVLAESGPLVRVLVEGAQISTSKLKELLPVFRDGVVDDPSLARSAQTLEDYFQRQGYLSASVKPERVFHADSQKLDITFQVNLGERGELAGYGVSGNRSVPTGELLAAISLQTQGLFQPAPVFSRELLENKANTLRTLYQSKGFLDVRITPHIDEHWENRPGRWFVTFEIEEGPRTIVRQLLLRGVGADMQKKLWPSLLTRPSQPYSPERARTDRDSIAGYLADRGYTHASVSWHAFPVDSKGRVDVEYRIEPGPQERIQRIVLLGNQHTRAATIRRELEFRNGRALSQSDLLESQRRLYDLGVFNQVQIATQEQPAPDTDKTVLVGVEEGRRWTLGYGGGVEVQRLGSNEPQGQFKASPRLSLDVTRLNVGGRAQTFTLRGRLSNLEKGGGLSYLIPRLFAQRDLSLRINGLVDRSRDVLTFTAEREEASVSIEKRYSPDTFLLGKYSFRRVLVDSSTLHIQPEAVPLLSRPARIAMLGLSYVNDRRDDPTDATGGSYSVADAGISWRALGSEASFLRFSGQNATYYRLGSHLVFARNTRFGVESPYGALRQVRIPGPNSTTQVVLTHDIPLPERYFMGGSESHRGFSINQAGPRDPVTGFPIGGNALFFNSLELRMPLAEKRLGFVLFHDAGNVFSSIRTMRLLKVSRSSPTDFNYASHAAGLGVRYRTPVGPVRFDVGYNLNPPRFQVEAAGGMEVRRLSQFQFFLSIGQSF
jgi:outer membrane protein assembly complex protein YaeT